MQVLDFRAVLADAFTEARQRGWATCGVGLDDALRLVEAAGSTVPTRREDAPLGILQARPPEDAHPQSLTAIDGLG